MVSAECMVGSTLVCCLRVISCSIECFIWFLCLVSFNIIAMCCGAVALSCCSSNTMRSASCWLVMVCCSVLVMCSHWGMVGICGFVVLLFLFLCVLCFGLVVS